MSEKENIIDWSCKNCGEDLHILRFGFVCLECGQAYDPKLQEVVG